MSNQVKSAQIIPTTVVPNNSVALPRDLEINRDVTNQTPTDLSTPRVNENSASIDLGSVNFSGGFAPSVPAIEQVKSQTVNILDDGSATIDVVLVLEDIVGVSEYDIRVAKDAGNV